MKKTTKYDLHCHGRNKVNQHCSKTAQYVNGFPV